MVVGRIVEPTDALRNEGIATKKDNVTLLNVNAVVEIFFHFGNNLYCFLLILNFRHNVSFLL
jgi:hypothetical protein